MQEIDAFNKVLMKLQSTTDGIRSTSDRKYFRTLKENVLNKKSNDAGSKLTGTEVVFVGYVTSAYLFAQKTWISPKS